MTIEQFPNFYAAFAAAAEQHAGLVAIEVQRASVVERMLYRELRDMAEATAAWLDARGVVGGDRVAILAENDAHWCAAYLGVLCAGAVAVPLDTNYSAAQVATLLRDSGAVVVFTSLKYAGVVNDAAAGQSRPPLVALSHDVSGLPVPGSPRDAARGANVADPAVMLYTSGTTSDPKGVVLTHANLLAERSGAFQVVHITEHDRILSVLPLFHALAQMANLLLPFSVGARVVFLETVNTTQLARALQERDITAFVCVPQFFYLLHRRIDDEVNALPAVVRSAVRLLARVNLRLRRSVGLNPGRLIFRRIHKTLGPALRILVTGGARFDPDTNRALHALGFTIQQAYGLTECSGGATVTRAGDLHLEAVGQPLPGVELRIAPRGDGDGDYQDGEVLIRGGNVMPGYFNRPEQNAITLEDGWLHTGDLGYLDPDGRLYVTGRSKEIIVLGSGKNIYPEEIESHYEKSPFIQELCVVGLARPGEPAAERLHALIRPDQDAMRARGMVNIRELLRFEIEGRSVGLPPHKRILGYDITLDPLPRTTTRKLKRFAVERMLREKAASQQEQEKEAEAESRGTAADAELDPIAARVVSEIRRATQTTAPLPMGAHLELDIGLDSMERVELLVHMTSTFGVTITDGDAQRLHTVGDLVEIIRPRIGELPEEGGDTDTWARLLQTPPDDGEHVAELAKAKWIRAVILFAAVKIVYAFAWLTIGLRTAGRRHLPSHGPCLISPNHQSYIDPFLVVAALPFRAFRNLFFVGAAEYFQTPLMAWLARTCNVIPIDPDANLVGAMQAGGEGLRIGKILVLFPEGERSIDGTVKTFRKGAAILSHHLSAPIVPVAIDGAWDVWARRQPLRWRALLPWSGTRVRIEFGPPLAPPDKPDYMVHTTALRDAVVEMWDRLHAQRTAGASARADNSVITKID